MEQEKIGQLIKKIRTESNLTQERFASKYGVTYQAVSKWETGKSIPDITILKKICEDYNYDINAFLNGAEAKDKRHKIFIVIPIILFIIIVLTVLIVSTLNKGQDFKFSSLTTTCDNFKLFGSIAYSENKTAIYISNITYCGDDSSKEYESIECTLYELNGGSKIKISSQKYDENQKITLGEFLKTINFNIDNYSKTCKNFQENGLVLEIIAKNVRDKTEFYEIPLKLDEKCS